MPMNNPTRFYIARHGQTDWNVERRMQGHIGPGLNLSGRQQAVELAARFRNIKFAAIFASDLARAHETAKIVALERALAVKTTKLLREKSHGRLEGRLAEEVRTELKELWEHYDALDNDDVMNFRIDKTAESLGDVVSRFIRFIRETAVAYAGQSVLVVTHGGVIRSFLVHLGAITHNASPSVKVSNAGYIVIDSDGIDFRLIEVHGVDNFTLVSQSSQRA